jgi:GNAT superfamily N-acetyltransferase
MALLMWHRSELLPTTPPLPGLAIRAGDDVTLLATLTRLSVAEIRERLDQRHQPYVALYGRQPVAYGWVAREQATVGEIERTFAVPARMRDLWDFVTLPEWRGQGVYPRLLQAILAQEHAAEQFWIIHAPENRPSARGIVRSGFAQVGELSFLIDGTPALAVSGKAASRASTGAAMLGVDLVLGPCGCALAPCWRCRIEPGTTCGCTGAFIACSSTPSACVSSMAERNARPEEEVSCVRTCPCITPSVV